MPLSDERLTATASVTRPSAGTPRAATPVTIEAKTNYQKLLDLNNARTNASIYNEGTTTLWIDYSADVGPDQHLVSIGPGQLWESPSACVDAIYGVWAAPATGEPALSGKAHIRSIVLR